MNLQQPHESNTRCLWAALGLIAMLLAACGDDDKPAADSQLPIKDAAPSPDAALPDAALPFSLSTAAFADGATVPLKHECGGVLQGPGENISPALKWTAGPATTASYAVTMVDVTSGIVHWVIYDIPAASSEIAEKVPAGYQPTFPAGAKQAEIQGSGYYGYFGPCSPGVGTNTYTWTIHAIPTATLGGVTKASTEQAVISAIKAVSIASASFSGKS